jgi:bacillithiol biosynthesis cysteine-adding enzyme BshC
MEPACLRHTDLPHTSRLFSDFLYHYHRVERFYTVPPATGYPEDRRPALIEALRQQNTNQNALDRMAQPRALAVVTGQQVGLFSGPAYTIYKALTAAKLARELSANGRPAVPVFWLATEDHDFAEVNHCWVFDRQNQPHRLEIRAEDGGKPVGTISVPEWPIQQLKCAFSDFPFGREVSELVEATHRPNSEMGESFRALLERLLEPYGFLFIDPMHPATRHLAAPMLRKAVEAAPELNSALLKRNRELEQAGYHAQVHVDARTSLFFVIEEGFRKPVRELGYSRDELLHRAEDLSPNALLRPVVQDYMLPTAAYIGGPAELAYLAQSQVLYERLLGHMPRIVSRTAFTLLDSRTVKLMGRYSLHLRHFFHGLEPVRERIAAALVPAELNEQFESTAAVTEEALDRLSASLSAFDPTLVAALDKSRLKIRHQIAKIHAKAGREMLRRDDRAAAEALYLFNGLYPNKHLQERFYTILPFLAQHGVEFIERLFENVRMDCPDHVLLSV